MALRRLRWRMRGAWLWPSFLAAQRRGRACSWTGCRSPARGPASSRGSLIAGFLNLAAVVVLGSAGGALLRRRRPDLPREVARDTAGAAAVVLVCVALVAAGLDPPPRRARGPARLRRPGAGRPALPRPPRPARRAPERDAGRLDPRRREPVPDVRAPPRSEARAFCLYVNTDQDPPGIKVDTNGAPNSEFAGRRTGPGSRAASRLEQQRERLFEQLADAGEEARGVGAVEDAVVARERRRHPRRATTRSPSTTARGSTAPTARIAACGGLMTASKLSIPNMPRFETVNVPPESSGGVIGPSRTRSASARASRAISPSGLRSASNTVGTTSASCDGDRDADVDAPVQLEAPVAVGAVDARELAQRERAGLDDEVVERRARARSTDASSSWRAADARLLHVDVDVQREVRDGRPRLGHPSGDQLLGARQLLRLGLALGPTAVGLGRCRRRGRLRRRPVAARGLDVGLDDPPARAAALQTAEIDRQLAGHPPSDGRGLDPLAASPLPDGEWAARAGSGAGRSAAAVAALRALAPARRAARPPPPVAAASSPAPGPLRGSSAPIRAITSPIGSVSPSAATIASVPDWSAS